MTDAEYALTQRLIVAAGQLVAGLDLEGFLRRIEKAEAVGPILAPSLYRESMENLGEIKRLAEACKTFQNEVKRQLQTA
jgi:hypothetical protein